MSKHSEILSKFKQDGNRFYMELLKEFPDSTSPDKRRERLLDKIQHHGTSSLDDRELISLLLCNSFRTRTVDSILDDLFEKFDSFHGILGATAVRLKEVTGLNNRDIANINIAKAIADRLLKTKLIGKKVVHATEDIVDHLMTEISCLEKVCIRVIFMNKIGRIISSEVLQNGTVDHASFHLRELFSRALILNASNVIFAQNDPSGDAQFTETDTEKAKEIISVGKNLSFKLFDYIKIGRNNYASMKISYLI